MNAEVLRRAAVLMRERAESATPGPWEAGERCVWGKTPNPYVVHDGDSGDGGAFSPENAEHIASWHPAVALAVANWLDWTVADYDEWVKSLRGRATIVPPKFTGAFAVARAYLGESA